MSDEIIEQMLQYECIMLYLRSHAEELRESAAEDAFWKEYIMVYMMCHAEKVSVEIESLNEELHQEKQTKSDAEKALQKERNEFEKTREQLQSEHNGAEKALQNERDEFKKTCEQLQSKHNAAVKTLQNKHDELKKTREQLQSELRDVRKDLERAIEERNLLSAQKETARADALALKTTLDREKAAHSTVLLGLKNESDESKKTCERLETELQNVKKDLEGAIALKETARAAALASKSTLDLEKAKYSTLLQGLKNERDESKKTCEQLQTELKNVKKDLEGAIAQKKTALTDALALRTILGQEIARYSLLLQDLKI